MRAPLIAIVLSSVSAAVCAQSANETVTGLESCFQSARRADSICSNPENDAAQRLDCLQKARTAQLECLQRVHLRQPSCRKSLQPFHQTGLREPSIVGQNQPIQTGS